MVGKTTDGLSLTLPMDSWYGARRFDHLFDVRDFPIPSKWHVEIFEPDALRGVAPLSAEQVLRSLQEPIGSESLAKLAAGRKDAVIIVDDLSRPTPAFAVLPQIISELATGGLRDEDIRIIIGLGTHRPLTETEQRRKLGRELVDRFKVVNHNAFTRQLTRYQRSDGGPDFAINRVVGEADLKISVSGIIPHGGAGFGGGAKAILPSVSAYDTIMYNHSTFAWEGYGIVYPERIESACIRRDMEAAARVVGLDFSVNLVFTPFKELLGVYAGDFVAAHRKGCAVAHRLFLTEVPTEKLDIVIAGGYPMDTDIGQSHRGTWPEKYGHTSALLAGARDGWAYHGDNGKSHAVYRRLKREQRAEHAAYRFRGTASSGERADQTRHYYSCRLEPEVFHERNNERQFFNDWSALTEALQSKANASPSVGVFPYASMQLEKTPA